MFIQMKLFWNDLVLEEWILGVVKVEIDLVAWLDVFELLYFDFF